MREVLYSFLDPIATRGLRVLETGSATGFHAQCLAERYGWTMFPTDLVPDGLRYAQASGVERLAQADMRTLPFAEGTFDAVVSLDVIVHLERGKESLAFEELARVLRPGGVCIVRVAALDILRSRHSMFAEERQRFTESRLRQCLEKAGLCVVRSTYANSLLLPVALFKFRLWEPLFASKPASGVEPVAAWLNRLLEIPLRIEGAWIDAGLGFPAGQSCLAIAKRLPIKDNTKQVENAAPQRTE